MSIPRRIIQVSISATPGKRRQLSPFEKGVVTNLRLLHPDWEYLLLDEDTAPDFIATHCPEYESILRAFRFEVQKWDLLRLLASYFLGGFYFDLDVLLSNSVAPLLGNRAVFPIEQITHNRFLRKLGMDWDVGTYAFGAEARNPFVFGVIENIVRAQRDPAWARPMIRGARSLLGSECYVISTTGPGLVTRTFAERPDLHEHVTILFPRDVRDRKSWHLFGEFGVHLMHGSWRPGGKQLRRRIGWKWNALSYKWLMRESHRLGAERPVSGIAG